jgi:hypothetical protein
MLTSRRDFLRLSAVSAVLALSGCSSEEDSAPSTVRPIVAAKIFPAIGVARVGNSSNEFFVAPELPGVLPQGPFKDASGAIKRQAVRFRVYGVDAQGLPVAELTSAEADITWTVHLANKKAAWYKFDTALDIPEAVATVRRNAGVADRTRLAVDGGPRSVSGAGANGVVCDGGRFLGAAVELGELRTDENGRLLVLGGRGRALAPEGAPLTTFADNDGWVDDTSDGPVTATVQLKTGEVLAVEPACAVVAPPDYGASIATTFRSLYDVMTQTMVDAGHLPRPTRVRFLADIYPLFHRLTALQWANAGLLRDFGWRSGSDFSDPALVARLADASPQNNAFRREWFERFRDPAFASPQPEALPPFYGDAIAIPFNSPRNWLAVTPLQYAALRQWAEGDFVDDSALAPELPEVLEQLPVAAQPAALDRAALEACLGDAFHPGCEMTWPMRRPSMYSGPFRLRHREAPEPDYGDTLTPAASLAPGGPLDGCVPGAVTRWMAVPWQTDTGSCRSGYEPEIDPYLPTFWPTRVPNHVLTEAAYQEVLNTGLSLEQREAAFRTRAPYFRNIDGATKPETLANIVANWHKLGVIERRPGPPGADFPRAFEVESENGFPS